MTGVFGLVHFARPGWLWALLALPLLVLVWRARRRDADPWREVVDAHLLPHLVERRVVRHGWRSLGGWLLAACGAILALAGPGWREVPAPLHGATSTPLVVALDLSTASNADDLPPSRLLQARAKLARLFAGRQTGETALLAYADDAFTVAPLTEDAANLALYLDALSPDVMPLDGHRPDRAIERATRLLRQRGATQGGILLVGSGADSAAIAEAAVAARMGYRVSALGLGTPDGAAHRDGDGALAHTRLDEAALRALVAAGGGDYRRLTADDADLEALGVFRAQADGGVAGDGDAGRTLRRADQGYWLLLPVMLLVLLACRRGGALALVACIAMLPLVPAQGQGTAPAARGASATPWQRADQVAHGRMAEAAEAYRAGRHAEAARGWAALPGADAAYNRGNALARQGEFDAAIAAYDDALRLQPDMEDAAANRAAVEAARRRTPPPGPGEDPRAPPRERTQDAGRPSPGDGPPSPGEGAPPAAGPPPAPPAPDADGRDADAAPPPPDAPATDAQREADAAQRERMQRALDARDAATDATDDAGAAGPDATSRADEERRRADAAWLRRVPDDPGGLLRAKFRLEHERRQREGE